MGGGNRRCRGCARACRGGSNRRQGGDEPDVTATVTSPSATDAGRLSGRPVGRGVGADVVARSHREAAGTRRATGDGVGAMGSRDRTTDASKRQPAGETPQHAPALSKSGQTSRVDPADVGACRFSPRMIWSGREDLRPRLQASLWLSGEPATPQRSGSCSLPRETLACSHVHRYPAKRTARIPSRSISWKLDDHARRLDASELDDHVRHLV
jgi:hypothetical protein